MSASIPAGLDVMLDHGIGVFPCRAKTLDDKHKAKSPLTQHGLDDASTDRKQIADWARMHRGCAWGAAMTPEIGALDIDVKPGRNGFDSLAAMLAEHGDLPTTLTSHTPAGGQHRFFRFGRALDNSVGKVAPGIDIRSKRGYVLVPPSQIESGTYRYEDATAAIAVPPDWLTAEIVQRSGVRRVRKFPEGQRNKSMHSYGCALRARSVPPEEIWNALQSRNLLDCDPPMTDDELQQIHANVLRYPPGFALTDLGNRDRLIAAHGDDIRYLVGGGWHTWTGHRFELDRKSKIIVLMADVARGIYAEAYNSDDADRRKLIGKWAKDSESHGRIGNAVALAQSHPDVVDVLEDFDSNPWLIGLQNGIYDLQRDEFREGRREDRITMAMDVHYDPSATCPQWEKFQHDIHPGKPEIVSFKQRALGYSLSGDTSEQVAFFKYGGGANGKGVEQETIQDTWGDYGLAIAPEVLMTKDRRTGSSNELAQMRGARLISTSEIEEGQTLAENLFKRLTGEDEISARFLYQEHINFRPVAKFWISSNNRPEIRGSDFAIWRRILVIPYEVRFTETSDPPCDPKLRMKLAAERSGIFRWLLEGYRAWKRIGLQPPDEVRAATGAYQADMNRIANFVEEQVRPTRGVNTKSAEIYRRFVRWWRATGLKGRPNPARDFHAKLERDHGLVRGTGGDRLYIDCALVAWEFHDDDAM
ncbi:MAG: phage/plasmid primase, P4 family [Gammaproteobacteria bacterium]